MSVSSSAINSFSVCARRHRMKTLKTLVLSVWTTALGHHSHSKTTAVSSDRWIVWGPWVRAMASLHSVGGGSLVFHQVCTCAMRCWSVVHVSNTWHTPHNGRWWRLYGQGLHQGSISVERNWDSCVSQSCQVLLGSNCYWGLGLAIVQLTEQLIIFMLEDERKLMNIPSFFLKKKSRWLGIAFLSSAKPGIHRYGGIWSLVGYNGCTFHWHLLPDVACVSQSGKHLRVLALDEPVLFLKRWLTVDAEVPSLALAGSGATLWIDSEIVRSAVMASSQGRMKSSWLMSGVAVTFHAGKGLASIRAWTRIAIPQPPSSRDTHGLFGIQCFLPLNNSIAYPSQRSFSYWFVGVSSKTSTILNGNKGRFYQASLKDTMQHQLPFRCNQTLWCGCSGPRPTWWIMVTRSTPHFATGRSQKLEQTLSQIA